MARPKKDPKDIQIFVKLAVKPETRIKVRRLSKKYNKPIFEIADDALDNLEKKNRKYQG